jgi:outer membrane receptor protein involved in Fe transport
VRQLHLGAFVALHDGGFDVPPELRLEDVEAGDVAFRGSYRFWSSRAASRRLLLAVKASRPWDWGGLQVLGWFGLKGFRLIDDRTGLLFDPVDGDGTDQRQSTVDSGLRTSMVARLRWLRDETRLEAGAELRGASQRQRLSDVDLLGEPVQALSDVRAGTFTVGAWGGLHLGILGRAALESKLQVVHAAVSQADLDDDTIARTRGWALLPKVAVLVHPSEQLTLDASWSRGWRPPVPQLVVADAPLDPTVVDTIDLDVRVAPIPQLGLEMQGFAAFGRHDRIYDLLDGSLLASGSTRRAGGELSIAARPFEGLAVVADAAYADARLVGSRDPLPYAPRSRISAALVAEDRVIGPIVLTGSLRAQWAGGRYLPGGFRAQDVWTLDLSAKVDWRRWTFDVRIENVAPWNWHGAEFVHPSRWDLDDRASALPVRHVVAGRPFALTLGVARWF